MEANELIDRYVHEVGQHLPGKTRADIEMELRSLLLDMLDEQSDGQPTPKMAAAMLRDFGHPQAIAAQYRPEEFLIGPTLFPIYKSVITITLSIIGILHLIGLGFMLWQSGGTEFVDQSLTFIFSFFRASIISLGIMTLVFAAIERTTGEALTAPKQAKTWDPFELPPVKEPADADRDHVARAEMVVGILFLLAFVIWLNFFPDWVGGVDFGDNELGIFALLTAESVRLIPLFSAALLLEVVLKTAVVLQGRWYRSTRWLELLVDAFGLYVMYRFFILATIVVVPFFNVIAKIVIAIILIVGFVELVVKLFRLLGKPVKMPILSREY
jgi:hypothetical protein